MANSNGWGDGAANNSIGWGQGANNNIGWGDSHAKSWAGATDIVGITTDADAQAFITAAAITDPTQQTAINNLVVGMKADGIWTKMKAIYPFVGGTASTHKWNLKDPRDLDAAFRLVFNGGWTHSSNGATPNGTNGYADTRFNPSLAMTLNSTSMSVYSRTNNASEIVDFGGSAVSSRMIMAIKWSNNDSYYDMYNTSTNRITYSVGAGSSSGLFISNRTSNVVFNIWKNNTKLTTNTNAQILTLPNKVLFLGANNSTTIENYSTRQYAFAHIADGLTDTEAANLYTRVQAFQTSLSRQV